MMATNPCQLPAELGALPFPVADVMLPGEQKQCHLYEDELIDVLDSALQNDEGLLVQTLEGSKLGLRRCAPLVQVAETRTVEEGGVWCMLKCIGRVEIGCEDAASADELERVTVAGPWFDNPTSRGPWFDNPTFRPRALAHAELEGTVVELHTQCVALMRELDEAQDVVPVPKAAADSRYKWGHQSYLPQFEDSLKANVKSCRDTLLERGMDCAPASSLHSLHTLWGLSDDDDDERASEQLLTFTACADLKRTLRARAVRTRSSHARLRLAHAALRHKREALRASLALEQAMRSVRPEEYGCD